MGYRLAFTPMCFFFFVSRSTFLPRLCNLPLPNLFPPDSLSAFWTLDTDNGILLTIRPFLHGNGSFSCAQRQSFYESYCQSIVALRTRRVAVLLPFQPNFSSSPLSVWLSPLDGGSSSPFNFIIRLYSALSLPSYHVGLKVAPKPRHVGRLLSSSSLPHSNTPDGNDDSHSSF